MPLILYENVGRPGELWVRPTSSFEEWVERDDYSGPRFKKLYCQICQVVDPVWGDKCRLCYLTPVILAVAWRLAALIIAFLVLAFTTALMP